MITWIKEPGNTRYFDWAILCLRNNPPGVDWLCLIDDNNPDASEQNN